MDNLDELKAIWHTAKTDELPAPEAMLQLVRQFRAGKLRKKWLVIACALALAGLMAAVLILGHFRLLTTYIGGTLIGASSLVLAATNMRSLRRFYQLDNCSNLEFLAFIERTRQNQRYYYQKTMVLIMLLCTAGLLLYLYEPALKHPLWTGGIYIATLGYLAIMWFTVRPRTFTRDTAKLDAMQQHLANLTKQLQS
jgi:Flp pilus assembly protein TadB